MRLSIGLGIGGVLGLSLISSTSPAEAADAQPFSWSWVRLPGAETCAAAEAIAGAVRARLGRDPFATPAARHIEGWVERSGDRWLAHLNVTDLEGNSIGARQLESADATCTTLVDAVTLAVVLTIDPQASLDPPQPEPPTAAEAAGPVPGPALPAAEPAPTAVVPAQTATACEPSPPPPSVRERGLALTAAVRALAVSGVLPRPRAGAEAGAELELSRRVGIAAAVGFLPSVRTDDKRFAFGLMEASLGPCVTLVRERGTRLAFCTEAQLGAIHELTYDVDVDPLPPTNHFWLAVRAGTRLNQRLVGPLGLELGVQALVPVTRHRFTVRGSDERVHQAKHLGFWASAGITASIP